MDNLLRPGQLQESLNPPASYTSSLGSQELLPSPSPNGQGSSAPGPMQAQELIAILRKGKGEMPDLKIRPDELGVSEAGAGGGETEG